jgi:hypothetical protein
MILNYTYVNQNNQSIINPDDSETTMLTSSSQLNSLQNHLPKPVNRKNIKYMDRSRPLNRIEYQIDPSQSDLRTISLFEGADNLSRYDVNGQLKSNSSLFYRDPRNNLAKTQAVTLLPHKTPNRTIILIPKPKLLDNYRIAPPAKIHPVIKNDLIRRSRSFTVNPRDRNRIINYIVNNNPQNYSNLINPTLPTVIDENTTIKTESITGTNDATTGSHTNNGTHTTTGSHTASSLDETGVEVNDTIFNSSVSMSDMINNKMNLIPNNDSTLSSAAISNTSNLLISNNQSVSNMSMNSAINNKTKLIKPYINLNDENNLNTYYYNHTLSTLLSKLPRPDMNLSQSNLNNNMVNLNNVNHLNPMNSMSSLPMVNSSELSVGSSNLSSETIDDQTAKPPIQAARPGEIKIVETIMPIDSKNGTFID